MNDEKALDKEIWVLMWTIQRAVARGLTKKHLSIIYDMTVYDMKVRGELPDEMDIGGY